MSKNKKTAAAMVPVPKNQQEAEALLSEIGACQRALTAIEVRMNDVLAGAKEDFEREAQPINTQLEETFAALHVWAEANKDTLLVGKAKTVKLASGELAWRTTPPSVKISKAAEMITRLRELGLERFIRSSDEIDKQAILGEREAVKHIKGITISQREEFVAKPFETELEKAAASTTSEVARA